ncbi:putative F-box domain-containing protein [Rosa chinensis]|uniref:Putative F-box domain-containing protein n=1 Tax=Rosa chinensis TaxID=74649 RepID=A0A2P6Q9S9_ROSCH|nr:putative F-box protein At3g21120 [Rosa chinensis]PRQ30939.1 putative F-box domain-containing protein [Rosa chinensis]
MSGSCYFPEEIIEEILLNLPIESLIRFTAVCKSWNFLIKSPSFIHTQSNKQNPAHLLLLCQNHWLTRFSLYWDNPNSFDVCRVLTGPSAINTPEVSYKVEGTCNGVVCLADYMHHAAVIWNPSVRKYVILPSPTRTPLTYAKYAFGYDSQTNDYKVLRILVGRGFVGQKPIPVEAEVWSLARGSWMSLNTALIPPGCEPHN